MGLLGGSGDPHGSYRVYSRYKRIPRVKGPCRGPMVSTFQTEVCFCWLLLGLRVGTEDLPQTQATCSFRFHKPNLPIYHQPGTAHFCQLCTQECVHERA